MLSSAVRRLSTAPQASPIVVVGSCVYDMIAYTPRLPVPGETIIGTDFVCGFGGKGANQAVQASMLGVPVAMVGKVGTDTTGAETITNFQQHGVDTTHVTQTPDAPSAVAPIAVDDGGNNFIVVIPGANMLLTVDDVRAASGLISNAGAVMCQLEIPNECTVEALRIAKAAGVTTVFNPAPAQVGLPAEIFEFSDFVCPNETEAEILTGIPTSTMEGCKDAALALLDRGVSNVLVTLGSNGALLVNSGGVDHVPAEDLPAGAVKDTSGAGDSFLGSFTAGLAKGMPVRDAMALGMKVAGMSVQGNGTQSSYRGLPE